MKVAWAVVCLAGILVGIGAACGPQEKYCYGKHLGCEEARINEIQKYNAGQMMLSDAAMADSATTVGGE